MLALLLARERDQVVSSTSEEPMPSALPSTTKGRGTRQRLKAAATKLFAERSYAAVRITDITEAAGLSPGAFYRYFEDRRELMLELLREVSLEAFDFTRSPMDELQPITSVLETTRRYFEFYEQHRALFGLMVELSQADTDVAEIWATTQRNFYSRISRSLARGVHNGSVRPDLDLDLAAEMLGCMTELYAYQRFVLRSGALTERGVEDAVQTLAEIWIRGVGHPSP